MEKKIKKLYFEDKVTMTTGCMILVSPSLWNIAWFSVSAVKDHCLPLVQIHWHPFAHCVITNSLFCLLTKTVTKPFYKCSHFWLPHCSSSRNWLFWRNSKDFWASCHFMTPDTKQWEKGICWRVMTCWRNSWITFLGVKYVGEEVCTRRKQT